MAQIVIKLNNSIINEIKEGDKYFATLVVRSFQETIARTIKNGTVLPEEEQPPCFDNCYCRDFDCDCYEIGEGGTPICTYDCERILENEPCHKYKMKGNE